jgi:phosphoribosylanthranilate isomerase
MDFRIKICGVTSVNDAAAAVEAGADALGLNFYRGSKRFVDSELARQIVAGVGERAEPVGVFVNADASTVCDVCRQMSLNTVQLHGEKRPGRAELIAGLRNANLAIIRAHSFGERGVEAMYHDMFDASGDAADAMLVDALATGMYGGTGQTIDWARLAGFEKSIRPMPLILAGGLTPENVAEAIRIVRPHAVDVASGVESSPGKKDPAKMRDFVAAARSAFL